MNLPVLQECAPYRCRITVTSCARRWRVAQQGMMHAESYMACRGCAVGEANASAVGEQPVVHARARDCVVCGVRYVPENFMGYARACSPKCKCALMREASKRSTTRQKARAKKKRESKKGRAA